MKIALLGSTGSIGTQCLNIVDASPEKFQIYAIAANSNTELFQQQLDKYRPKYAAMGDPVAAKKLIVPKGCELLVGAEGVCALASLPGVDTVLVAIVGIAGLDATLAAVQAGKRVALANKEALVTGGELITRAAKEKGIDIYPVDSEHSAIFQCKNGENVNNIKRLILTASGGAFRDYNKKALLQATPEQALCHPNWSMGKKITIDCATMMNKGLEVIEAHWLFDIPVDKIDVVIHRESIVHSMVEFNDSAVIAQLGSPDMRLPIIYALTYPERMDIQLPSIDFTKVLNLSFAPPDTGRFPCLGLAYAAITQGGGMPTVLNAANEVAVDAFLNRKIGFMDIAYCVEYAMNAAGSYSIQTLADVHFIDQETRARCQKDFVGGI